MIRMFGRPGGVVVCANVLGVRGIGTMMATSSRINEDPLISLHFEKVKRNINSPPQTLIYGSTNADRYPVGSRRMFAVAAKLFRFLGRAREPRSLKIKTTQKELAAMGEYSGL